MPTGHGKTLGEALIDLYRQVSAGRARTSYDARGWHAQLRALTDTRAGREAADRAGLAPTARTLLGWLAETTTPNKANREKIAQAYGAEGDAGVQRDVGPSGVSTKAQFDRSMAQAWRQRLGNLTGRGAIRSGDLGYQTREQGIANDVGVQGLVSALLGGISGDVSGVDAARQQAQKAIDDAIQNARNAIIQNPEAYAAMLGITKPPAAPDTTPADTTTPSQSPLQSLLSPAQFGILQSVFGGAR